MRETEAQAAVLEQILERYDTSRSVVKDAVGRVTALGQAMSGMFVSDEVVKGSLASYTFEHMEIASYRILIATAEHLGDESAARGLAQNLQQEIAMADWLADHLAETTRTFLIRDESGATAKR